MIDLHTHHERCGHADGTLADVVRWALAHGIAVLGLSDHAPRFADPLDHPLPGTQMARSQWDAYLAEGVALRDAHRGRIDLRIGTEADYLPGTEDVYREALARPELDYVLGSVHEVGSWHVYKAETFDGVDADEFHAGYWRLQQASATSGLFDVIAHLDAIRAKVPPPEDDHGPAIEATLDAIADAGVAVEVNGSGLRRDGEVFPRRALLEGLVRRDVPITFGSDSHSRRQLGAGWSEAVRTLADLGVSRLATFRGRERAWVEIGSVVRGAT
ncbi:MAG: histidinol-phosphatase [Trueperaceae bacterium]|nr:histidinol-phosphatase [Trueperaceae bacterium]